MAKPGPQAFLDAEKRRQVCLLVGAGCSRSAAARRVGCARSTISNTARREPDFAAQLSQAEFEHELDCLQNIQAAGKKSWRASAWLLERSQPERFERAALRQPTFEHVADFWAEGAHALLDGLPQQFQAKVQKRLDRLTDRFAQQTNLDAATLRGQSAGSYLPDDSGRLRAVPVTPPAVSPTTEVVANQQHMATESTLQEAEFKDKPWLRLSYLRRCQLFHVRPFWEEVPEMMSGQPLDEGTPGVSPVLWVLNNMRRCGMPPQWAMVDYLAGRFYTDRAEMRRDFELWEPRIAYWEEEFRLAQEGCIDEWQAERELAAMFNRTPAPSPLDPFAVSSANHALPPVRHWDEAPTLMKAGVEDHDDDDEAEDADDEAAINYDPTNEAQRAGYQQEMARWLVLAQHYAHYGPGHLAPDAHVASDGDTAAACKTTGDTITIDSPTGQEFTAKPNAASIAPAPPAASNKSLLARVGALLGLLLAGFVFCSMLPHAPLHAAILEHQPPEPTEILSVRSVTCFGLVRLSRVALE